MTKLYPENVDYRRPESCAEQGSGGNEPTLLFEGFHTLCWDLIRRETAARKLTAEYVVDDTRDQLLASVDAWKTVTCPGCADTWRLSGYGLATGEILAVRQALLAAVVLAV